MDRVLIFNLKQGWDPLCEFLDKEVPKKPFPWLNKGGSAVEPMMRKHPFQKQLEKEFLIVSCFVIGLLAVVLCMIVF